MRIETLRKKGYQLLHEGVKELSRVEANGIRIDVDALQRTKVHLKDTLRSLKEELEDTKLWKRWKKRYGLKTSVTSRDQFATVLFQDIGYESKAETDGGKPATDEEALSHIEDPAVRLVTRILKYDWCLKTPLRGIEKELVNGRLHPVFNLHLARTYRSSSDNPNFQNFPVRDKEIAEIIRSLFIASPGCVLSENDFKGIEVSISACYHHDRNFISYITTPGKDMHRDMAGQIYFLDSKDVSKDARYGAKNKFVFPQFYGDFYLTCARSLWEWIEKGKLTTPDGKSLFDHLKEQGITELGKCDLESDSVPGTFEHHLKEVEDDFWNRRFMDYGQWRKDWYRAYLDKGYFDLLTGFRVFGSFKKNSVTNYPIQGSAFHCLLWCLIRINRLLRKYRMESKIIGQIHDSLIGDIKVKELRDYLEIVEQVTTVDLPNHYKWINVPMVIEYELSPRGGTWFDKQEINFTKGRFVHPSNPKKHTTDPLKFLKALEKKGT